MVHGQPRHSRVTIVRVEGAAALVRAWKEDDGLPVLCVEAADLPVAWAGMRHALSVVCARFGDGTVRRVAHPLRSRLGICLPDLADELDEKGQSRSAQFAGSVVARVPFSSALLADGIADAWAELLAGLYGATSACIAVPEPLRIDPESWEVFPLLLRKFPGVHLVFGDQPWSKPEYWILDRIGEIGRYHLARIESLSSVQVDIRTDGVLDRSSGGCAPPLTPCAFDNQSDSIAARSVVGPRSGDLDVGLVINAAKRAFNALSFHSVAHLTARLLSDDSLPISRPEIATLRLLRAVALHALAYAEPQLAGEHGLWQAARREYLAALPDLKRPLDRALALYHQSLFEAKDPNGDIQLAAAAARGALAESTHVAPAERPLTEGYAHNALAFALLKAGDIESARQECSAALSLFVAADEAGVGPATEARIGAFRALNNLSRLAFLKGQRASARALFMRCEETLARIEFKRPFFTWFDTAMYVDDLAGAASHFESRAIEMSRSCDEASAARYCLWAANLRYMLGDAASALRHFERTQALWSVHGADEEQLFDVEINCVISAFQAEMWEAANDWLERALRRIPPELTILITELHAMSANLMARRGDTKGALDLVGRIEQGGFSKQPDDVAARSRLHRHLGEIWLSLGQNAAALSHFRQALDLTRPATAECRDPLSPDETFATLAGILEAGDENVDPLVHQALAIAPVALTEANAWWDVKRVLPVVLRVATSSYKQNPMLELENLSLVCNLVGQRQDCEQMVSAIRSSCPGL